MMELNISKGIVVPEGFSEENLVEKDTLDIQESIIEGKIYEVNVISADVRGVMVEFSNGLRELMDTEELLVDYEKGRVLPRYKNGKNIYVKVIGKTDQGFKISRVAALNDLKAKLKEELKEGQTVIAKVEGFNSKLAFLELGGYQGIMPITEYSWVFAHSYRALGKDSPIALGKFVKLVVKGFQVNEEGIEQVILSRKLLYPNPWPKLEKILSPDPEITKLISDGRWKASRQALKLQYKRARTEKERTAISRKIGEFDLKLPRIEGVYLGPTFKNQDKGGSVAVEIYKDPVSGDSIIGRALYPSFDIEIGARVQYVVTEFNSFNKTIFGVIKDVKEPIKKSK